MNKIITSLNPKNIYVKSQRLIVINLVCLALCAVSWWFLIPTLILWIFNLVRPNISVFQWNDGKKLKLKVTKKAWKKYRQDNHIPWNAQWGQFQIEQLVRTDNKEKFEGKKAQKEPEINTSKDVSNINKSSLQRTQVINENKTFQNTQPIVVKPREVKDLPKLNANIDPTKNKSKKDKKYGMIFDDDKNQIEFDNRKIKLSDLNSCLPNFEKKVLHLRTNNGLYTFKPSTDLDEKNLKKLTNILYKKIEDKNKKSLTPNELNDYNSLKEKYPSFENDNQADFHIDYDEGIIFVDDMFESGSFRTIDIKDINDVQDIKNKVDDTDLKPKLFDFILDLKDKSSEIIHLNKMPIEIEQYDEAVLNQKTWLGILNLQMEKFAESVDMDTLSDDIDFDLNGLDQFRENSDESNNKEQNLIDDNLVMHDIRPSNSLKYSAPSYDFNVSGTTHHDLKKAVNYAREAGLFDPYYGATASDIRDEMIYEDDPEYETDLKNCLQGIALMPEPDNKYDPDAIKVNITLGGKTFFIGYVPSTWTEHVHSTLKKLKDGTQNVALTGHMIGGKYKFLDDDEHVRTKSKNVGFVVEVHTEEK